MLAAIQFFCVWNIWIHIVKNKQANVSHSVYMNFISIYWLRIEIFSFNNNNNKMINRMCISKYKVNQN